MFANENSGVFGWLIGLVVIVMVGVGLSTMVDRRFQFSSNNKEIVEVISSEAEHLADLLSSLPKQQERYDQLERPRMLASREADELKLRIPISRTRIEELTATLSGLKAAITSQEDAMDAYRKLYRDQTWQQAIGEQHAEIVLRNGRRFEAVSILRVTAVGLEISHKDGRARIGFPDLNSSWRERFQWSLTERQSTIDSENVHEAVVNPLGKHVEEDESAEVSPTPVDGRVEKLRSDLLLWNSKVSVLKGKYNEASSKARSGQNSVPGALETWAKKADRLSNELSNAKLQRERARAELKVAAPGDPYANAPTER